MSDAPLRRIRDVVRSYAALRPLRVQSLTIVPSQIVSVRGLDAAAAPKCSSVCDGRAAPDSGEVELFGRSTRTSPTATRG